MRVLIIGGGNVGLALAQRLTDRVEHVVIIDHDQAPIQRGRELGVSVCQGDGTDAAVLRSAGAANATILVAATGTDDANLLVAQLASSKFDIEQIITRVNDPDNEEIFADLGVRTISGTLSTAWAIDNVIERPALSEWMTELRRSGDVQEIEITAAELVGQTIAELDGALPDGCLIALVGRNGETQVPSGEFVLEYGDHITVLGRKAAVFEALSRCHPHD
jgi:Trk K+ transport system NAD-binding subunit